MHLDSAAVAALNILPKPGTHPSMPSYRWQSILGVLDHCRTPQGHRLMSQWVKQPLRSCEILNDRHNIVQCLLESPESLDMLSLDYLKRIPDILLLTKKLMRRKATLQDLFRIYQVILRTPKILQLLLDLENSTVHSVLCAPIKGFLEDLNGLKQMVEQVVDFESIEKGEYLVKGSFDSRLMELQQSMTELFNKMEKLQSKCNDELDLDGKQVKLENVAKLGYHFRITLKDDSVLRKNKNYRIVDVIKGGVRFTSDKLESYANEFGSCRISYEEQQQSIVEEIIQVAVGYAAPLTSLNNDLAQLDCLVSFAIAARCAPTPYVRPKMLPEGAGQLKLDDIRHPCLELQEHVSFIANSVEFEKGESSLIQIELTF